MGRVAVMRLLIAQLLSIANFAQGEWNNALAGVLCEHNELFFGAVIAAVSPANGGECPGLP